MNEAAVHEANELAVVAEGFRRERNVALRRVVGVCVFGFGAVLAASAMVMAFDPPFTTISGTRSCSEDTCLCWLEEHHTWARFDCSTEPAGTCFRSYGTCSR